MRRRALAMVVLGAAGWFLPVARSEAQQSQAPFSATATADLARGNVSVSPAIVVESLADPGAVTAQVALDSLTNSTAFAANPYPGTLVRDLPGLLAGAAGTPSLPDLIPTVVASSHPVTPTARFGAGPMELRADSTGARSEGSVTDGANRSVASVVSDPSNGEVVARAESVVAGLELSNLVRISGYRSTAELRRTSSGEVVPSANLSIARLTILDQSFSIGPDGVQLLGSPLPIGGARELLDALLMAVAGLGVGVDLLEPVVSDESVLAPGLVVTYATDVPNVGRASVSLTVGRSVVTLSSRTRSSAEGGAPLPVDTATDLPLAPDLSTGTPLGPLTPVEPGAPVAADPSVPTAAREPLGDLTDDTPLGRLYPALFIVGCLLFASTHAFHHLAEKLAWTS